MQRIDRLQRPIFGLKIGGAQSPSFLEAKMRLMMRGSSKCSGTDKVFNSAVRECLRRNHFHPNII